MNRTEILDTAKHCVDGPRNASYGEPEDNFRDIAAFWNSYLGAKYRGQMLFDIDPVDVAWMMIDLKKARAMHAYNPDNYVDCAGYAATGGEVAAKMQERP